MTLVTTSCGSLECASKTSSSPPVASPSIWAEGGSSAVLSSSLVLSFLLPLCSCVSSIWTRASCTDWRRQRRHTIRLAPTPQRSYAAAHDRGDGAVRQRDATSSREPDGQRLSFPNSVLLES